MGARLSDLIPGAPDVALAGITADSRAVKPGFLFAALPGARADGSSFARAADKAGAAAILAAAPIKGVDVPVVVAEDVRRAYAKVASAFYGPGPTTCVAVTGTNGKTSVAVFCRQIFAALGHVSASIGTLGVAISRAGAEEIVAGPGLTTPDAGELARIVADLARRSVTHLALEASSHGIDQRRLDGLTLKAAGFTNLTQDHLDYHGDMGAYRDAKLRLFETQLLPAGQHRPCINSDSPVVAGQSHSVAATAHNLTILLTVGAARRDDPPAFGAKFPRTPLWPETRNGPTTGAHLHGATCPSSAPYQASNALVAAGLCYRCRRDNPPP